MLPKILEDYSYPGVDVAKIVRRVVKYVPQEALEGLEEILILDKDPIGVGFAAYCRTEKRIELYVSPIIGWQPWILKKSYVFPYFAIALALGHEIDHHVRRGSDEVEKERCAEDHALEYIYPSLGAFKPFIRLLSLVFTKRRRTRITH
jgi:hypothetical protein